MLSTFARLLQPNAESAKPIEKAALVINIREPHFLSDFKNEVDKLKKKHLQPYVVFFEASDDVLQRRFSETRRPHPADTGKGLKGSIKAERKALERIRTTADLIVDTSDLTVHSLRRMLIRTFGDPDEKQTSKVQLVSFGHKFGGLRDVDLMFDVRHFVSDIIRPWHLSSLSARTPTIRSSAWAGRSSGWCGRGTRFTLLT